MEHSDGSFDIGWFDQAGSKQQASGVPGPELEPYIPSLQASAVLKDVFCDWAWYLGMCWNHGYDTSLKV